MSKYVIKNCPALIKEAFQNNQIDGIARTTQIRKNLCFYNTSLQCENINDCVMKKIVERLIKVCNENLCSRCDGCDWENGCGDKSCGTYQANDILTNLLDIEECE